MPLTPAAVALAGAAAVALAAVDAAGSAAGRIPPPPPPPTRPLAGPAASAAPVATQPPPVGWRTLGALDLRTGRPAEGQPGEALRRIAGTAVMIPGYIVPLEDDARLVREFLLVPYVGACVHLPPPPPNQMVYVTVTGTKPVVLETMWRPVWVEGRLDIDTRQSVFGAASFSIRAVRVIPYEM